MGKTANITSFAEVEKISKNLQSFSETYTKIYTQLLQKANTMGSAFEGADNLAFVEQINGFTEELKMMAAKISQMSQIIEQEKVNYANQQNHNINQVKKLVN